MSGHTVFKWLQKFNERKDYPFKQVNNSSTIYCKACEKSFDGFQKVQFSQQSKSGRHKQNMQLKAKRTQTQAQLEDLVKQNPKKSVRFSGPSALLCLHGSQHPLEQSGVSASLKLS